MAVALQYRTDGPTERDIVIDNKDACHEASTRHDALTWQASPLDGRTHCCRTRYAANARVKERRYCPQCRTEKPACLQVLTSPCYPRMDSTLALELRRAGAESGQADVRFQVESIMPWAIPCQHVALSQHLTPDANPTDDHRLRDPEDPLGIAGQDCGAGVGCDLHRFDRAQRAAGEMLAVGGAERRVGREQHPLGTEEVERELEHLRHEILARGVAIELLEVIDVGPRHLVGH